MAILPIVFSSCPRNLKGGSTQMLILPITFRDRDAQKRRIPVGGRMFLFTGGPEGEVSPNGPASSSAEEAPQIIF